MESLNEEQKSFTDVLSPRERMEEWSEDELQLRQGWTSLTQQVTVLRHLELFRGQLC